MIERDDEAGAGDDQVDEPDAGDDRVDEADAGDDRVDEAEAVAAAEEESEALEVAASSAPGSNSLLAAALLGSGATLIVGLLGVARTKVLAVGLGPEGLGLYGQILTLLTALSAASGLGLGLGTTRVVAEQRSRGDRAGLRSALEVSFALPLAVASILALAIAACSGLLATLLLDDDRALLIVFAALAVPIVALQGPLVHALQGFRDVAGAQGSNVFFGVTLTVASILGVVVAGLEGAVLALAAGNLAYAAALAWRLHGLLRPAGVALAPLAGLRPRRLREPAIRAMLGIGLASLFVGVIAGLGELAVRTFVLREDGADAAGIFQALQLISVQLFGVIVTSVVFLSFTAISESHAAGDRGQARRTIDDTLRLALLLALPVLLAIALFREDVIRIFLSAGFGPAAGLLPQQLVGDTFRTVAFALGAALVPLGLTRIWATVTTTGVVVYVVAAAILVEAEGLDGAILAYVIWWGVAAALTAAVLVRRGFVASSRLTLRTLAMGALAVGVLIAEPDLARPLAALAVTAYGVVLCVVGTGGDERAALLVRARGLLRR
jgi:O-antigen/teichoic acid export membrane protein